MGQQCERMDRAYGHANLEDLNAMTVLPRKTACAEWKITMQPHKPGLPFGLLF
jgi:hypothetical protein